MAIDWPSALPDCPQTWSQVDLPNVIRSDVDIGVAKVRRRYTRTRSQFAVSLTLPKAQFDAFETFYRTTLKDGLLTFNYKHPYTGVVMECRFLEPPGIDMSAKAFSVSMVWEQI